MPMFALAEPEQSALSILPSTVVHSLLVAGAIVASRAVPVIGTTEPPVISISWPVAPAPHAPAVPGGLTLPGAPTVTMTTAPDVPTVGSVPATGIPRIDPRQWVTGTDSLARLFGGDPRPGTSVLTESDVDDPPGLLAAGPLRYPLVLEQAGITGSVTLSFVIDTEGRVEPDGIEVLSASHPGFVPAATEAIKSSRFTPAHQHGQLVRVRVRQTVSFRR